MSRDLPGSWTAEISSDSMDLMSDSSGQMEMMNYLSIDKSKGEKNNSSVTENHFKNHHAIVKSMLPHGRDKLVGKKVSNDRKRLLQNLNEKSIDSKARNSQKLKIISLNELAWHDSSDDCWIAVYDYVYDCTEFLKNHPGGLDVILEYAGRDATIAFIGTGHSKDAKKLLQNYLIGELPVDERLFRKIDGIKIVEL